MNSNYRSSKFIGKTEIKWRSKWVAILGDSFASGEGNPDIPYSRKYSGGSKSRRRILDFKAQDEKPARWLNGMISARNFGKNSGFL